jgi:hypothetical protein
MKQIAEDEPLSSIDIKFTEGMDFREHEGEIIPVYLESLKRDVPMIVTTSDSPAKKHGQDGLFTVCSDACGKKLQAALREEINQG